MNNAVGFFVFQFAVDNFAEVKHALLLLEPTTMETLTTIREQLTKQKLLDN